LSLDNIWLRSNDSFVRVSCVGFARHPSEFAPSLKHLLVKTYLVCMFWLISHKNKLCRVQWSLDALRSKETFDNVIFTDETSVEMGSDGRLFFYQRTLDLDQPKALRTLDMYEVVTLTSKTRNSLSILRLAKLIHCCDGATCQCTFYFCFPILTVLAKISSLLDFVI
jgi:hypothetical protein